MKFLRNIIISLVAILPVLTSCKQDDTLQYNNMTMGNITDGTFVSDLGNIFNVVEKNCSGDLTSMKRALLLCDVLNKVEGTENEYDIRLNQMSEVLVKNPITKSDADDADETRVADPILIDQMWISGGYINMYVTLPYKQSSKTIHEINLVKTETKDGYEFRLVHNANGETMTDSTMYDFVEGGGYFSFPISSIITEDEADVRIVWKWYRTLGTSIDINTTGFYFTEFTYKKGYEHIPAGLSLASTVRAM